MVIILGKESKIIVQGITGHQGMFHARAMRDFGSKVVAGVTPGKGGEKIDNIPVYNDVDAAVKATGADVSVVFVPAPYAKDAVIEAIDAGIKLVVIVTEHIPFHDVVELVLYSKIKGARIIGPNCPGIASPGLSKAGIMPNMIFKPGNVGVLSRSGTLTYEVVNYISDFGFGESTVIGLGGDQVIGTTFIEALSLFEKDPDTKAIVMVGEIGGSAEEDAAGFIKKSVSKPVIAYIAGRSAPPGKRMGHAGAIISRGKGTAESKIKALEAAGVKVADLPINIPKLIKKQLI